MQKPLKQNRFIKLLNSMSFDRPSDMTNFQPNNGMTRYSGKQKVVGNFLSANSYSDAAINTVLKMKDPNFNICALSAPFLSPEQYRSVVDILDQVQFFSIANRAGALQFAHFKHITETERLRRALYNAINLGVLSNDAAEKAALMVMISPMLLFMDSKNLVANREIQTISAFLQKKETHVR